jgi:hypothetical protein
MNADKCFVLNLRLSVFIGGQLFGRLFQQPARGGKWLLPDHPGGSLNLAGGAGRTLRTLR